MKKTYLKPEAEIFDFVVANMIATSGDNSGDGDKIPVVPGEGDEFANRHRGEWGNVWAK